MGGMTTHSTFSRTSRASFPACRQISAATVSPDAVRRKSVPAGDFNAGAQVRAGSALDAAGYAELAKPSRRAAYDLSLVEPKLFNASSMNRCWSWTGRRQGRVPVSKFVIRPGTL
jgi:hypothetical protein